MKIIKPLIVSILIAQSILLACMWFREEPEKNGHETGIATDDYYQLFYGEWEVTNFIRGSRVGKYEQDIIGEVVTFNQKTIATSGGIYMEAPEYMAEIVPMSQWHNYCEPGVPNKEALVFDKDAPYFVHVWISNSGADQDNMWIESFYIKDENTLVFDAMVGGITGLYQAVRVDEVPEYVK